MAARSALDVDDVVVSKFQDGHLLWIVTPDPSDRLSLSYRGTIGMSSTPWREAPDSLAAEAAISGTPLMRRRRLT